MKTIKKARPIIDGTSLVIAAELLYTIIEERVKVLDKHIEETEKAEIDERDKHLITNGLESAQIEIENLMTYLKDPSNEYQVYLLDISIDEIKKKAFN